MGDTFPSEDQSWRTSALSCCPLPPGITFATWVSSYSQQHCQWKRLESLSTRRRERERETPLIRRRRRMRFNIGWPVRGRGQLGKGSWSRWDTRTYDPRPLLVPLTNVSWHPPGTALLLEGRRHPLTRDSAVSVTRGREPNLIPSHPCSRRPWRPFNYWRDCARVSWSRII